MDNEAIIKKAFELGTALKETDEVRAADAAEEAFGSDEALQSAISEYSAQQESLAAASAQNDELAAAAIKTRIQALYEQVTKSPRYIAYNESQQAVNALMAKVNDEINFAITGHRDSCGGDCSGCHGCH